MCDFFSGLIDKKGFVYTGSGDSHSGIADAYKLRAGSYREFEWTEDDKGESLSVRTEGGTDQENWWKALILGKYPTRKELFKALTVGRRGPHEVYYLKNGILSRPAKEGPAFIDFDVGKITFMKDGDEIRAMKGGPCSIMYNCYEGENGWVEPDDVITKQSKAKFDKIIALGRKLLAEEYEKWFKKPVPKKLIKQWSDCN